MDSAKIKTQLLQKHEIITEIYFNRSKWIVDKIEVLHHCTKMLNIETFTFIVSQILLSYHFLNLKCSGLFPELVVLQ